MDGHDFEIIFTSDKFGTLVIGQLKAFTDKKALNLARKMYKGGEAITVRRVPQR